MRTDKFQFTIRYFRDNKNADKNFVKLIEKCLRKAEEIYGTYVSFTIIPSIALGKSEWGYSDYGDGTYILTAIRNPQFNANSSDWKNCCINIVNRLKAELNQATITGEFSEVVIEYWR